MKHAVSFLYLAVMCLITLFIPTTYASELPVFQSGKASWYGSFHHGKKTASGERFNMHGLSAAHRTLPLGSMIAVTNKSTGKTITVKVNDRGPYHGNRILDLSKGAAKELGMISSGVGNVEITVLSRPDKKSKPKVVQDLPKIVDTIKTAPNLNTEIDTELMALNRQIKIGTGRIDKVSPPSLPETSPSLIAASVEIDPLDVLIQRIDQDNQFKKDIPFGQPKVLNVGYTYQQPKMMAIHTTDMF